MSMKTFKCLSVQFYLAGWVWSFCNQIRPRTGCEDRNNLSSGLYPLLHSE